MKKIYNSIYEYIEFGKYKNIKNFQEILCHDFSYYNWLEVNIEGFKLNFKDDKEKEFFYYWRDRFNKEKYENLSRRIKEDRIEREKKYEQQERDREKKNLAQRWMMGDKNIDSEFIKKENSDPGSFDKKHFSDGSTIVYFGGPCGSGCYDEFGEEC